MHRKQTRWAAMLACTLAGGLALADPSAPAVRAVWAIGLPNGYAILEYQERSVEVSAADVARGEVEVRGGSRLAIVTRAPGRFALQFDSRGDWIRAVRIRGLGSSLEFEGRAGTATQRVRTAGRHVVDVDYQFLLAPGVTPGSYAWPLRFTVRQPLSGESDPVRTFRRHDAEAIGSLLR